MLRSRIIVVSLLVLLAVGSVPAWAQTVAAKGDEPKLIAVLTSNDASRKDKADACRQLAVVGTKAAIPTLAALLSDEELSHNARYALEPIPDPAKPIRIVEAGVQSPWNSRTATSRPFQ